MGEVCTQTYHLDTFFRFSKMSFILYIFYNTHMSTSYVHYVKKNASYVFGDTDKDVRKVRRQNFSRHAACNFIREMFL